MESVFETNHRWPLGIGTRDLDGIFDGFGACVQQRVFFANLPGARAFSFSATAL